MGLPLSIDETFMSHIETDPGLSNAIMSLIQSGEIGIVTVSQAGVVTQSAGVLADWAVPGAMVEENAPWLKGLGDRIAAIGTDAAPPLRLEHIAVLDDKGQHDRVVSLNAVTATEAGATLLVLRDATQTAILQREVLQQRNALALAEAEVKAAQNAAEAASRAKSDFLAKVNHELRTPLHVVLGNAELLATTRGSLSADERESLADDLLSEGQYLLGLIDDLLDLSRAEAGAPLLEVDAFLVDDVVSECIAAVSAHLYAEDITFEYAPAAENTEFVADRRAIRQIASNLLSNAAKFSPSAATVRIQLTTLSDGLTLTVIDSGPGLTKQEIKQALEPFGQVANQSESRAPRGAGVGLPLVKALSEAHGGSLRLESTKGNGLTASVWLPRP